MRKTIIQLYNLIYYIYSKQGDKNVKPIKINCIILNYWGRLKNMKEKILND